MENKELMDCLLSESEIVRLLKWETEVFKAADIIAKAQLNSPKLAEYIQEQKVEAIEALNQYNIGKISGERCAEIIGISLGELLDLI